MDTFYSFLIFAILVLLELLAAQSWLAAYYRFGIPVMSARRKLSPGTAKIALENQDPFAPRELAKKLTQSFSPHPGHTSLQFKALSTKNKSQVEIAFHEALFNPQPGFRYLPVTHALARMRLDSGEIKITGYLDWYVVFVLMYLVQASIQDLSFIFIAVIVLIIFGVSFLTQRTLYGWVAERLYAAMVESFQQEEGSS
jgi:hypothetical protein